MLAKVAIQAIIPTCTMCGWFIPLRCVTPSFLAVVAAASAPDFEPRLPLCRIARVYLPWRDDMLNTQWFTLQERPLRECAAGATIAMPIVRVTLTGTTRPQVPPVCRVALPPLLQLTRGTMMAAAANTFSEFVLASPRTAATPPTAR
mmetsp:Transcript_6265/g.10557  ORF Transcript_6265/g.10557 Transcript_6265/m.10557 type:complete len:147 (+) Transcript_6265:153-593(+)